MTSDELSVCQKFHIPVVTTGKYADEHTKQYFVNQITQFYDSEFRTYNQSGALSDEDIVMQINIRGIKSFHEKKNLLIPELDKLFEQFTGITYDVTLERFQRCVFSIDSHYISVVAGFEPMLQEKVKQLKEKKLDALLTYFLESGFTKKDINNILKTHLDKLMRKNVSASDAELEKEFNELWLLYPNKKDKKVALNAYIRARKKGVDFETVKQGIEAYNNEIKRCDIQKSFIKHGGIWFKNECWNDEYNTTPVDKSNHKNRLIDSDDKLLSKYQDMYLNSPEWDPDVPFSESKYYQMYLDEYNSNH